LAERYLTVLHGARWPLPVGRRRDTRRSSSERSACSLRALTRNLSSQLLLTLALFRSLRVLRSDGWRRGPATGPARVAHEQQAVFPLDSSTSSHRPRLLAECIPIIATAARVRLAREEVAPASPRHQSSAPGFSCPANAGPRGLQVLPDAPSLWLWQRFCHYR